jgi:ribonucleotide reductase beta subunit family protein with ferritin-like domain
MSPRADSAPTGADHGIVADAESQSGSAVDAAGADASAQSRNSRTVGADAESQSGSAVASTAVPFELTPNDSRLSTFPVERQDLWAYVKFAQRSHWIADEITFQGDADDYVALPPDQQRCLNHILGFFATGDAIVNINLAQRFRQEIPILEVTYFYDAQIAQENVHAETYSAQLESIVRDVRTRDSIFEYVHSMPSVKAIADWMYGTIDSGAPLAERILRMACVEGIFFQGCFCVIYWFASRGLMKGLVTANHFIARDESLHTNFALHLYLITRSECKLPTARVHETFARAVDIAIAFTQGMMPNPMPEMNLTLMSDYIRWIADGLLVSIEQPRLWPSIQENPIPFMQLINVSEKTNFFELRNTNYSKQIRGDSEVFEVASQF